MTSVPAPAEASGRPAISPRAWLGILVAATLLVYFRTIHYPFFFDDWAGIVFNPRIQDWREVPSYFTKHLWYHATGDFRAQYYRPLYLFWFLLNYKLFGIDPVGWRLAVLLLHCCNVVLVFKIAKQWLPDERAAVLAAAVFALHPAHIESLGWISAGGEPLAALAVLLALLTLMRASDAKSASWVFASTALYLCALLLKESTAVFPVFAGMYLLSQSSGGWRQRLSSALTTTALYIPPAAVYLFLRWRALHGATAPIRVDSLTALLTLPSILWFYFQHLLLPVRLTFFNAPQYVTTARSHEFMIPLLLIAAITIAICLGRQQQVQLAFGWVVTFLLLPVLGIWVLGESMLVQDRYLYLPLVGFALIVGCLWRRLAARSSRSRQVANIFAILLLVAYVAGTAVQVTQWSSEEALYARGLAIHPGSVVPRSGLALIRMQRGDYAQAESMLRQLHAENPRDTEIEWKLGMSLYLQKRFADAIPLWQHVIANSPVSAFHDSFLARAYFETGDFQDGVKLMNGALAVTPEDTNLRLELANHYLEAGDRAAALEQYHAVLARHPEEKILRDYVSRLERAPAPPRTAPAR